MKPDRNIFNNLFIFELANNHMGDLQHGLNIIRRIHAVCQDFNLRFGFKFQYRDLDTFIHPDSKKRDDLKYIKRFLSTRLDEKQFETLKAEIDRLGFVSICTPFDEKSVDLLEKHNFDILKVSSCSATDWPLLERAAKVDKPVIVSTAGLALEDIDRVVSFLVHRNKVFALMHCVAEYPTPDENLQLNQIDFLRLRYPDIDIGYSTHERPDNLVAIKIAIAKGAVLFEKHTGIKTKKYSLNDYSAGPEQIKAWLKSACEVRNISGVSAGRPEFSRKELFSLYDLRRGVFAKTKIFKGQMASLSNTFLAIPTIEGQVTANDMSKYVEFYALNDIDINRPLLFFELRRQDNREKVYEIIRRVKAFLKKSRVLVPQELDLEISHHYGIERFWEYGCTIINFVNRQYCKKLIVVFGGQRHPEQYHQQKEETFQVLYGDFTLYLDGAIKECKAGDIITIQRNTKHSFTSKSGAAIEEISSTHYAQDSYYTDKDIAGNINRKTLITYWLD